MLYRHFVAAGMFLVGLFALPGSGHAADKALIATPGPKSAVVVQESACLRWIWQELSWYDDCWWRRHPYVGPHAVMHRTHIRQRYVRSH
jgi:hypothetical protein